VLNEDTSLQVISQEGLQAVSQEQDVEMIATDEVMHVIHQDSNGLDIIGNPKATNMNVITAKTLSSMGTEETISINVPIGEHNWPLIELCRY